jgi:hypothetical protein
MSWTAIVGEPRTLYSQIGLRLIDEFIGDRPPYRVAARLSYQDSAGEWHVLPTRAVRTPAGSVCFPGLGRSASFATAPIVRHRVQLISDFYRPEYLRTVDALEFDIHPYNDDHAPAVLPATPQAALLLPSAAYPFATHLRVVRGSTRDAGGGAIANVEVLAGASERVLSDERGVFALPLRWPALTGSVVLDAIDHRTGRTAQLTLTLPQDLLQGQSFTLT